MDPKFQFIWFTLALIFLGLEAVVPVPKNRFFKWGWAGLFSFVVVFWWTALKTM